MDRYERILSLHRLLKTSRYPVSLQRLKDELGCSRATLYRDIAFLRDALGAPIESGEGDQAAFRYDQAEAERFELPGLWLTSDELSALLALNELVARAGPSILADALAPFEKRMQSLLSDHTSGARLPTERIRVIASGMRKLDQISFRVVAGAVMARRQLKFSYRARSTGSTTERRVSPQRLAHYRDNWYLDAWCHLRGELRSFSIDAVRRAESIEQPARHVSEKTLDSILGAGYGIFSGRRVQWAKLRFTAERARWVSMEQWHPKQKSRFETDGRYLLQVPFSDSRELVMDILKQGAAVEVLAPASLRRTVADSLATALRQY